MQVALSCQSSRQWSWPLLGLWCPLSGIPTMRCLGAQTWRMPWPTACCTLPTLNPIPFLLTLGRLGIFFASGCLELALAVSCLQLFPTRRYQSSPLSGSFEDLSLLRHCQTWLRNVERLLKQQLGKPPVPGQNSLFEAENDNSTQSIKGNHCVEKSRRVQAPQSIYPSS